MSGKVHKLNVKALMAECTQKYEETPIVEDFQIQPSKRTKELLNREVFSRTYVREVCGKHKIKITPHAKQSIYKRIRIKNEQLSSQQILEVAHKIRYKGVLLTNNHIAKQVFANEKQLLEWLLKQKDIWYRQDRLYIFYNDTIWVYGQHDNRTLITMFAIPVDLREKE